MDEILDDIKVQNKSQKFSTLSFIASIIACGLFYCLFKNVPKTTNVRNGITMPPLALVYAFQAVCIVGVAFTIMSFNRKEKSTWCKWLGAILNILLVLILIGSTIFAKRIY
jgi:cytochrome bd-type quinol oxidase subunit 2